MTEQLTSFKVGDKLKTDKKVAKACIAGRGRKEHRLAFPASKL